MANINSNYLNLAGNYLFAEIARKVKAYEEKNPKADIIRLGIGDVTLPLTSSVLQAIGEAAEEMGREETFRGYGPERGYDFLIKAIIKEEYEKRGVCLDTDEVFISDGSKCDVGNIQEIFSKNAQAAIGDPVYPVYLDSNVMAGRSGKLLQNGRYENIIYMPCVEENGFAPQIPAKRPDLIYICSPNNPTGTALTKAELEKWVAYAIENDSVILYDSAYCAYIQDPCLPRTIYEIPQAKKTAIEFKSFSKTAGFTGVRCAFTVVPKELKGRGEDGKLHLLNALWNRRQTTKFNGVSYIVQKAAAAVYSETGKKETAANVAYYMENSRIILEGLKSAGFEAYGGENAPYIWWKLPKGIKSMDFLDILLDKCQTVGTPGSGFGPCGEGYFRLTAFGNRKRTEEAVERIKGAKF